jgi:plastocyanin domain-containing protein
MKILVVCLAILIIVIGILSFRISKAKPVVGYVQVIKATYDENGFRPTRLIVKAGMPVRLEVKALVDGLGCMGSIMIPELSSDIQGFEEGKTNVFEVTPPSPGTYVITCAMGIPHGVIVAE